MAPILKMLRSPGTASPARKGKSKLKTKEKTTRAKKGKRDPRQKSIAFYKGVLVACSPRQVVPQRGLPHGCELITIIESSSDEAEFHTALEEQPSTPSATIPNNSTFLERIQQSAPDSPIMISSDSSLEASSPIGNSTVLGSQHSIDKCIISESEEEAEDRLSSSSLESSPLRIREQLILANKRNGDTTLASPKAAKLIRKRRPSVKLSSPQSSIQRLSQITTSSLSCSTPIKVKRETSSVRSLSEKRQKKQEESERLKLEHRRRLLESGSELSPLTSFEVSFESLSKKSLRTRSDSFLDSPEKTGASHGNVGDAEPVLPSTSPASTMDAPIEQMQHSDSDTDCDLNTVDTPSPVKKNLRRLSTVMSSDDDDSDHEHLRSRVKQSVGSHKSNAAEMMAEILKEVESAPSTITTNSGASSDADLGLKTVMEFKAAKLKEEQMLQRMKEKKLANDNRLAEERKKLENKVTTAQDIESTGTHFFKCGKENTWSCANKFKPVNGLLQLMQKYKMRATDSLPTNAAMLDLEPVDVQFLLVTLLHEPMEQQRHHLVKVLSHFDDLLNEKDVAEVLKVLGTHHLPRSVIELDENNCSGADALVKVSSYSEVATKSTVNVKEEAPAPLASPARRCKKPASRSPQKLKAKKSAVKAPLLRSWSVESLDEFLRAISLCIKAESSTFYLTVLLLIASDSATFFLQSPTSAVYGSLRILLNRKLITVHETAQIALDCLDLKSAQLRFLNSLMGVHAEMQELYRVCTIVFLMNSFGENMSVQQMVKAHSENSLFTTEKFMEHYNDFTKTSDKPSSWIRYTFDMFLRSLPSGAVKKWSHDWASQIKALAHSREDLNDNLNDIKFNCLASSWASRMTLERDAAVPVFGGDEDEDEDDEE